MYSQVHNGLAVDVTGPMGTNEITPSGEITEIIDGIGNTLEGTFGIAVDSSGDVFVTGYDTDNAFKIESTLVFGDGFETRDTSAWSTAVP